MTTPHLPTPRPRQASGGPSCLRCVRWANARTSHAVAALRHAAPLAVDASADSFRFYSGGLYHNPECAQDPKDLDHAVILR